jgi:L1 cell adhesion molecule like protein
VIIKDVDSEVTKDILLLDVAPLSLSIETAGQMMTVLIPRNSMIPAKKPHAFTTYSDDQPVLTIKVYEEERQLTKDKNMLGTFDLTGIPPAPRGAPQIEVTFDVNAACIMIVPTQDKSTGNVKKITIKNEKGRLSQHDIDRMVSNAEKFKEANKVVGKKIEAKNVLEGSCFGVRNSLNQEKFANALKPGGKDLINKGIEKNRDAEVAVFEAKEKKLEGKLMPLIQATYHGAASGPGGFAGGIDPSMFSGAGGAGGGASPPPRGPRVEEVH